MKYKSHGALKGQHETRQIFSLSGFSLPAQSYAFCLRMNRAGCLSFLKKKSFLLPSFNEDNEVWIFSSFCGLETVDSKQLSVPTMFSAAHKTQREKSKDGLGSAVQEIIPFTQKKIFI